MANLWSEKVEQAIAAARAMAHHYAPSAAVIKPLSVGAIYVKADMDTDADGSPRVREIDEFGMAETALGKHNGWTGTGDFVNAEQIPYFVLPAEFNRVAGVDCRLGDMALVNWHNREAFAIYADIGPKRKIGEGSIKLVESLGGNPWSRDRRKIISGIGFGVEYLIFPHSSKTFGVPSTCDEIQAIGRRAFEQAFGE